MAKLLFEENDVIGTHKYIEYLQQNYKDLEKVAYEMLNEYEKLICEYSKYNNTKVIPVGIIKIYKKQIEELR